MNLNVIVLCLSVLGLFFFVQARDFGARSVIKDNFELPKEDKHTRVFTRRQLLDYFQHNTRVKARQRRDAPLNCPNPTDLLKSGITTYKYKFPSIESHFSFSMTWVGKEYKTILLLATSELLGVFSMSRSALYRSTNYGINFKKINADIFGGHIRKDFGIQRSPIDPDWVILVSYSMPLIGKPSTLYISQDGAMNWKSVTLPFTVDSGIEFHPRNKKWLIAKGSLRQGAYLSTDFGFTWKKLRPYVRSVKWGARQDLLVEKEEQTIFLTMAPVQHSFIIISDLQLWRSRNLGKDFKIISRHVYSFGVQGPFLFFTVDYNKNNKTRIMHVSKDGGDTQDVANVPAITPEQFYSILDMSEGMVFLHVDDQHDTGRGVIYTSDADGIVYDKSLENHVYTNLRAVTDFYKVESMNGTYITSKMNSDNSLTTVITFDRGGEWNVIKLTDTTLCGNLPSGSVCSLQIHNKFSISRRVKSIVMGPVSESSAVGIIIAHANPGVALLSKNIGIWVSRDGGYTWNKHKEAGMNGGHHYAIADHGNLLLAIPDGQGKELLYSVNEGACWFKYQFTKEKYQLTGLVTSPGAKSMKASLWGYTINSKNGRQWQVYTLNFRQLLSKPCYKSDYTEWIPHASGKNKGCLLGKKVTFLRPKPEVLCFNGEDYIPKSTIEYCECTQADLECEYGYYREVGQDTCKPDKNKVPKLCLHGDQVKSEHKGYRLVPGDMCDKHNTKVEKYIDTHIKCQNASFYSYGLKADEVMKTKNSKSVTAAVVIPIVLVAVGIFLYFAKKFWDIHNKKSTYQYTSLSQDYTLHDNTLIDDDIFDDQTPNGGPHSDDDAAMIQV